MANRYCLVQIPFTGTVVLEIEIDEASTPTEQTAAGVALLMGTIKPAIDAVLSATSLGPVERFEWNPADGGYVAILGSKVPVVP